MARIAGITFNKTPNGKIKSITFDVKKHGELLIPILRELGLNKEADEIILTYGFKDLSKK